MNDKSSRKSFVRNADESYISYLPFSSSIRRRFTEAVSEKVETSMDSFSVYQKSADLDRLSTQTSNFGKGRNAVSFGADTINYIAQEGEKARNEIVTQYAYEVRLLIKQDEFIDGELSRSERYMIETYEQGSIDFLADALMTIYASSLADVHMLEGILSMISCVPYDVIAPKGQIMALGLLTNKSLPVRDKAIQCFEKWNSKKGLDYLKNINCSPVWLQKYVDKVIMYIERDGID